MKRHPVRHRLEYALYVVLKRLFMLVPHEKERSLSRRLGLLYHVVSPLRRRIARNNVALVLPELGPAERNRVVRDCFAHYGSAFTASVTAERFTERDLAERFDVEGWEHVETAREGGRGFLLMSGHFGDFELSIYPMAHRLGRLHVVARPPSNRWVSRDVERTRQRFGVELVPRKRIGFRMLKILRKGGALMIMIDQRVVPHGGILVPFMGRPAWTSRLLAWLTLQTGAAVVPLSCVPAEPGRYRLTFREPIWPEGEGVRAEAEMTRRYLELVEREIREQPELWLWLHRRWKLTHRYKKPSSPRRISAEAQLPAGKTFQTLDPTRLPAGLVERLDALARGRFLDQPGDVVTLGAAGTGKTHTTAAVAETLVADGLAVSFESPQPLARSLIEAERKGESVQLLRRLDTFALLILDGVGDARLSAEERAILQRLIDRREGRCSTWITSRLAAEHWPFGGPEFARRALRLETGPTQPYSPRGR